MANMETRQPNKRTPTVSSFRRTRMLLGLLVLPPLLWMILGGLRLTTSTTTTIRHEEFPQQPIMASSTRQHTLSTPPPPLLLSELTNTHNNHQADQEACEAKAFVYVNDIASNTKTTTSFSSSIHSRIPKIVHQTSKSRCMTKMFAQVSTPWRALEGYDYYLHDDSAMMRLLVAHADEFPILHDLVQANCLPHGTLKADIWRYLVLWTYGGIYADIDTQPTALFNTTLPILKDADDGWFVVEQFHVLSQYVMAVSPRHPLMYYAIHHATTKVLAQMDTGRINAALVTGPHALHRAFQDFCKDAGVNVDPQGVGYKPVWAGVFEGTKHRSITVVGRGEFEGEFIQREMMSLQLKKKQYAKMNMTSFRDDKLKATGQSCLSALFQYHQRQQKASSHG